MKLTYLVIGTLAVIMSTTGCKERADKIDDASQAVEKADQKIEDAKQDYLAEVENYRNVTSAKITENEKNIEIFNNMVASQKKEVRDDYKRNIAELEAKNKAMKAKMEVYKADSEENWEKFKKEFSHDMDELGNSFRDFTIKNVKK
ncbi:MAG: hypothetical protein IPH28_13045 [Cytophagaceae bacterium]|nr:hypothetical protein [Cytophagaceae bacterium]MBK9508428.1 hypothetical protein [Cytophagaceae bacterium]MBK9932863.1 hypothetical protein [Cytophagaceae bacterium]MBL0303448.1 hypothetical protein [Cytophagaceae bacterium]MBL0326276.1 hypothetical protein [Cytophagaceae bacterium]